MTLSNKEIEEQMPKANEFTLYKKRWLMLALYSICSAANALPWSQFSIIANIITKYYGVSTTWVDWTSMVFFVVYIIFVFPGTYFLDKLGLKVSLLIGTLGTCVGAWIKVASVFPGGFWLAFVGQTVVAFSQTFIISLSPKLAAAWFSSSEVSTACSIGVSGNQLGVAIGLWIPPILINSSGSREEIGDELYAMFLGVAIFSTVIFFIFLILFESQPKSPPSQASSNALLEGKIQFLQSLKTLFSDKSYMLLFISYGINGGVFFSITTLLNQIILPYYPNAEHDVGRIGLLMTVAGIVSSPIFGLILDKWHKYKETIFVVYTFSLIGMVVYTFTLSEGILVVYASSILLGFFMPGLLSAGFEFAAEITYPISEATTSGLLVASVNIFAVAFTNIYSVTFYSLNDVCANIIMCLMLLIGLIMSALIKADLKRQTAGCLK